MAGLAIKYEKNGVSFVGNSHVVHPQAYHCTRYGGWGL